MCVISSGCHGSLSELWLTFPGNTVCHCPLVIYSISIIRPVFVLKRDTTEETVYFDSRQKYIIVPFTSLSTILSYKVLISKHTCTFVCLS